MNQQLATNKHSPKQGRKTGRTTQEAPYSQLDPLIDVFRTAMGTGFYGSVEVKLENGRITIIKKTESIKLP